MITTSESKLLQGTITLANGLELVAKIVKDMAGNDVSNSLNDATATAEIIHSLSAQRIVKNLIAAKTAK